MSTKTSFKRIAAVAAVALTLGGFTAVSANAASVNNFNSEQWVTAPTAVVGVSSTGVVATTGVSYTTGGADWTIFTATITAEPATSSLLGNAVTVTAGATGYTNLNGTSYDSVSSLPWAPNNLPANSGKTVATAVGRSNGYYTVAFTPDVAGSYTLTLTNLDGAGAAGSTYSVTVVAAAQTFNHASAFIGATGNEALADAALVRLAGASVGAGVASARVDVRQYASADATQPMAVAAAVTVAVSGAGLVDTLAGAGAARGPSSTGTAANLQSFTIFSDGRAGVATVTVSIGGVVLSTKTLTFTGTLAKYVEATTDVPKAFIAVGGTDVRNITGVDLNANAATLGTIYAVSSNTAVATVGVVLGAVTVTGVSAGTASITVCDTSACTSATKTLVLPVEVTKATAKTVTISTDSLVYAPGQKITLTVTATDANGRPVGDGPVALFSATGITSDVLVNVPTYTASASVTLVAGKATFTAYAPISGSVNFSATQGAAVDAVIAGVTAAAITAPTVSVVNASVDAAQAAQDAANEATDAANAATDAANNAMDSADAAQQAALDAGDKADAALAAVTDLATKVSAIAVQISALSAIVAKISAAVAKISVKVKA